MLTTLTRSAHPLLQLLLVALLVLLPLRMAWSAAAGYCAHESTPPASTAHFGHHVHTHEDEQADHEDHDGPGADHAEPISGMGDPDCSGCHAWVGQLPSLTQPTLAVLRSDFVAGAPDAARPAPLLPDIDRPKWRSAA